MKLIQLKSAKRIGDAIIEGSKKARERNMLTASEYFLVERTVTKVMEELEKYALEIPENTQEKI